MNCVYETETTPSEEGHKSINANADLKWVLRQERVWDCESGSAIRSVQEDLNTNIFHCKQRNILPSRHTMSHKRGQRGVHQTELAFWCISSRSKQNLQAV